MARETITTNGGLVTAAMLVKNRANMWVVLGKQTAWTDEEKPDSPSQGTSDIIEPLVAIKAQTSILCREVSSGDYELLSPNDRALVYSETGYVYLELVPDEDAYEKAAKMIYIDAVYAPLVGMPEADFRIYGTYSGLIPAAGYENAEWLSPINVDSYGLLINLSHGKVYQQTELGRAVQIPMLIEFNF